MRKFPLIFNKYQQEKSYFKKEREDEGQSGASIVMATNWKIFLTFFVNTYIDIHSLGDLF